MADENINTTETVNPGNNNKKKGNPAAKRIIIGILLVVVIITGIAGIGFAQKIKQMRDKGPMFFMMERITKDLNLDDKQKAELEKIREEIKAKMETRKQDREKNFADFENLFKQDKINKEDLKLLIQKHEKNREEMKEFMMDEFIKFHALLTSEQKTKAIEKMHEMKYKRHKSFNHEDKLPPNN